MRNLTIKRNKSFVGSLAKVKVYIEDHCTNELTIQNVPCRKLGDLKNGEEKTFQVGEESVKIFVIADTLSKDYCNELYELPVGTEDVFLSGKNTYNPTQGNPFRFDGVANEATLQNRKKGKGKGILVMVIALVVGAIIGFVSNSDVFEGKGDPKTFSGEGMSITLTDKFEKMDGEDFSDFTVCYASDDFLVMALEEEFSSVAGLEEYSLEEYGEVLIDVNELDASYLRNKDGMTFFEYSSDSYAYYAFLYKADDAFWMIQFTAGDADADQHEQQFIDWAKTVVFE